MALYDYICDGCGARVNDVVCPMSEVTAHVEPCPECGLEMRRLFNVPALTGDLPTRGVYNGYYDPQLRAHIYSKNQRKRLMEQRGLKEFEFSPEEKRVHEEANYITKHAPDPATARRAVNEMAAEVIKKHEERVADQVVSKVVDSAVGSL